MDGMVVIKQEKKIEEWASEKLSACFIGFIIGVVLATLVCIGTFVNQARDTDTELRELGNELDRTSNTLSITTDRLEQAESVIGRCQQSNSRISEIAGTSTDTLRGTIDSLRGIKQEVEVMEEVLSVYICSGNDSNDSTVDKGEVKQ